jgi:hypothetical protein
VSYNPVGVWGLMAHAVNKSSAPEYGHSLNGDLNQMGIQGEVLRAQGFDVRHNDVYPCLRTTEDFKRALQLFWDRETEGWWNYRERMIEYGICTEETWKAKLDAYCERRKERSH